MQLVDGISKEIGFEHAGGASEGTQSAWTFRTAKVAGCGWFDGKREWASPMEGSAKAFAELVTGPEKKKIADAPKRQFGQKIQGISSVQSAHALKIKQGY